MGDPFADPDDVAARWRPLSSAEETKAAALLVDASSLIRAVYPGIDDQITSEAVDSDAVLAVAAGMVKRAMIGLDGGGGASQMSEAAGPFSASVSFANPMGSLYLTAVDDLLIRGYQPSAKSVSYDTS